MRTVQVWGLEFDWLLLEFDWVVGGAWCSIGLLVEVWGLEFHE